MTAPTDPIPPEDGAAPELVMLVGSPRSGTTWLQSLLGAHPAIATPQETDLFRVYLQPLADAWDKQMHGATDADEARRRKGLPLVLTEPQFLDAGRALLRETVSSVRAMKPSAVTVVEKSPSHSTCVGTILRFAPRARFVHIVRDGRDAVSSMVAAANDWGKRWAPASVAQAARTWKLHVQGAMEARHAPGGYYELRYEDLLGPEAPALLRDAFALCGVSVTDEEATRIVDEHAFDRMRARGSVSTSILTGGEAGGAGLARTEPAGFFRKGREGAWREEWNLADRRAFASVAGDLLVELGYEADGAWIGGNARPALHTRAAHRGANSTARALRALAERVERLPLGRR